MSTNPVPQRSPHGNISYCIPYMAGTVVGVSQTSVALPKSIHTNITAIGESTFESVSLVRMRVIGDTL